MDSIPKQVKNKIFLNQNNPKNYELDVGLL